MSRWSLRNSRYHRLRREFLSVHRVCALRLEGCTTVATTVDHVVPASVRPDLRMDPANWAPACRPCNLRKGAGAAVRVLRTSRRW